MKVLEDLDIQGNKISNIASPIDPNDAATKSYVDSNSGGGSQKIFVQNTRPAASVPFVWYITDESNTNIINMLVAT